MTQFQNKRLRNRPLLSWNRKQLPYDGIAGQCIRLTEWFRLFAETVLDRELPGRTSFNQEPVKRTIRQFVRVEAAKAGFAGAHLIGARIATAHFLVACSALAG